MPDMVVKATFLWAIFIAFNYVTQVPVSCYTLQYNYETLDAIHYTIA